MISASPIDQLTYRSHTHRWLMICGRKKDMEGSRAKLIAAPMARMEFKTKICHSCLI